MNFSSDVLDITEKTFLSLRELYSRYGYRQYKMSKFEEYDLYSRNKDFLVNDSVITFTDTNGKLMALKPDVTLSIVRNVDVHPGTVQKLCYNESVYRVAKHSSTFREIMQTGLECIGNVDSFCIGENLWLAANSLALISPDYMLDISQLDILSTLIMRISDSGEVRQAIMKCVGEKNLHEISAICQKHAIPEEVTIPLKELLTLYGAPRTVLPAIRALLEPLGLGAEVTHLEQAVDIFTDSVFADRVQIDFSVTSDPHYYNGIVFKGFINGIPESVLSGGQYDRLMEKMGRSEHAIGFAVYLDTLERMETPAPEYDVDILLLYDSSTPPHVLRKVIDDLIAQGRSVEASSSLNPKLKYRQAAKIIAGGVEFLETNA